MERQIGEGERADWAMGGYLRGKGRVGKDIVGEGGKDLSDKIIGIAIANK